MNAMGMLKRVGTVVGVLLGLGVAAGDSAGQPDGAATHTIFMTAVELKGATTADKLAPPTVNPGDLSKGYGFKGPGQADKADPRKWEVASYTFVPGFVTVRQGDTVNLTVFVVNGDEHEVRVTDPTGRDVVAKTTWNRGREYQVSWVAEQPGAYHLTCTSHAPSMGATVLALPRK